MALSSGNRLGPYEIAGPIGAGGMGEVYRARDTRLNREVAIKVLPPAFSDDPDRRARFDREAQTVAALSHANVVNLFDTGVHEGQLFVVMELLDGESLRERLIGGALPARKAVEIGIQVARGLAAAHDKGVIHRDLKPDNIFLLADGQVKILDFGLARQVEDTSGAGRTVAAMTNPGTVMGTVGYMSPEQVRGGAVDARSDLFALGAVLYEMLTGQQAFGRDTPAETMTAILKDDPPEMSASRAEISPSLDRIIRHCLEKNPLERFQTARDVAFALEALSGSRATAAAAAATSAAPSRRGWVRTVAIASLVIAAVALGGLAGRLTVPRASPLTFEKKTWDPIWVTNARFGPDGQTIVFSAAPSGNVPELFVIRPDALLPQPVGQTATHLLSVSSKGELAVITGARFSHHRLFSGTLARMTLDGAPRPWMEDVREADWSPDGSTLAVIHRVGGQDQLEYPIGQVRYRVAGYLSDPRVSPDGTKVAFMEHATEGDDRGWLKLLGANDEIRTLAGEFWGEEGIAWSADGRNVLFSASRGGAFQALRVNASGTPAVNQLVPNASSTTVLDMAVDGRLLIVGGDFRTGIRALIPGESEERELSWLDNSDLPFLSADRRSMVFTDLNQSAGNNYAVAVRDLASGRTVRLGEGASFGLSPDGRWAGGLVMATQDLTLYPTGAGQPVHLSRGPIETYTGSLSIAQWFPDGKRILVCGHEKDKAPRCYQQDLSGSAPQPVSPEGIRQAWLSPDGTALIGDKGDGAYEIHRIGGGPVVPVRGVTKADSIVGWSTDMQSVIVNVGNAVPARVEAVNITSGARKFLREIAPPNAAGVTNVSPYQWFDRGYTYSYRRTLDAVYVVH